MLKKTLVIVAHPNIENSRVNAHLMNALQGQENITIHQLYKEYPDFNIDVATEQKLLTEHDNVVLQFPLYWYSVPALLKQWLDMVLTYGFSHGIGGDKLKGKKLQIATSTAMSLKHYNPVMFKTHPTMEPLEDTPVHQYLKTSIAEIEEDSIDALLKHLEQSAYHISMDYQKPFVTHSAIPTDRAPHAISEEKLNKRAKEYLDLIKSL